MLEKETLKHTLFNFIDAIDSDNSNYTKEELTEILDTINHITDTQRKLSKYQACDYLGISRATFDNHVRDGIIPEGKKEIGFKEKFWTKKDLMKLKNEH